MCGATKDSALDFRVIPGMVTRLRAQRFPKLEWNALEDVTDPHLAEASIEIAYYANGYVCRPADAG